MSGFGKRQPVSASALPSGSAATPPGSVTSGPLPFSFLGLLGGTTASVVMLLLMFYGFRPTLLAALAADPEAAKLGPDVFKHASRIWWWTFFLTGILFAVPCCVVTHWVAYVLRLSELWLFALLGLVCSLAVGLFALVSGAPMPEGVVSLWFPYTVGTVVSLLLGPATTSTYWLIAKWRAA